MRAGARSPSSTAGSWPRCASRPCLIGTIPSGTDCRPFIMSGARPAGPTPSGPTTRGRPRRHGAGHSASAEMLGFRRLHPRLRHIVRRGGHIVVFYRTHGVELLAPRDVSFIMGAAPASDAAVVWFQGSRLLGTLQRLWDERLGAIRKLR